MAEVKNTFIKSKMNKDLDDRILSKGEYRDALNVSVSKSEDSDVGALENALGNLEVTDLGLSTDCGLSVIGHFMDPSNDRMFLILTNYTDISGDQLSNFASSNSSNYIYVYYNLTNTYHKLIEGQFLNFSKTHPISGINLLEDLLFWTDNRNQPRKINVVSAENSSTYYQTEDTISVAKFYPSKPIDLYKNEVFAITSSDGPNPPFTLPGSVDAYVFPAIATTSYYSGSNNGNGFTVNVLDATGLFTIVSLGSGYETGDILQVNSRYASPLRYIELTVAPVSTMRDVTSRFLPDGTTSNPYYDESWDGDPDFLKDKFIRFSYRFKFDDGEYSLMAPFTQPAFVPDQDGYFKQYDEDRTYQTTEVKFMENKVDSIGLIINSPTGISFDDLYDDLKVTDIDILYKESNGLSIKVVDTINKSDFPLGNIFEYNYKSQKAYKTLPEREIVRVFDKVPVRALSQEVIGNRVCYGNYLDKHTPPRSIDYTVSSSIKKEESDDPASYVRKEYQNHTLKQNRTYQVGIILSDRYGRQSDVVLSNEKDSTLYHAYKTWLLDNADAWNKAVYGDNEDLISNTDTWPGDSIKLTFNNIIPETITSDPGYPGIYSTNNPLGWHSYKVVVKQQEQDYYNVYNAGILNGYINDWSGTEWISVLASEEDPTEHMALFGDNINKVPRDLIGSGNQDRIFRAARPTYEEDPMYYRFTREYGVGTESETLDLGETSQKIKGWDTELRQRDRERGLLDVDNASIKMYCRVTNYRDGAAIPTSPTTANKRFIHLENSGTITSVGNFYSTRIIEPDVVNTVATGVDLGLWDPANLDTTAVPAEPSPSATATEFYNYQSNPFIARISADVNWNKLGSYGNIPPYTVLNPEYSMSPTLAIYELAPERSRLDLFWETSTTGLVPELNTLILSADNTIPAELEYIGSNFFYLNELWPFPASPGVPFQCSDPFKAIGYSGSDLPDATMILSSVTDGNTVDRTSEFTLFNDSSLALNKYYLKSTSTFWYGNDINSRDFNFTIQVTNGSNVSNLTLMGRLGNWSPEITSPASGATPAGSISGTAKIIPIQGENGSTDTVGKYNDLTFDISSQYFDATLIDTGVFYITPHPVAGYAYLSNYETFPFLAGSYTVIIRVTDAGGFTDTLLINPTLS